MNCEEARKWLGALQDGELDVAKEAEIRTHLSECGDCREEMEGLRALREATRQVSSYEASDELRRSIRLSLPGPKRQGGGWKLAVAGFAAGALLMFFATLTTRSRAVTTDGLVAELVTSHSRSLLANHLLDVKSSSRHTVKPWFIGKVGTAPTPWDLASEGFPLLGGRLDYVDGRPTEVFVYGRRKHFINLFVLATGREGEWSGSQDGFQIVGWKDDGLCFVAVSDIDPGDLLAFSRAFRKAKP